MTDDASWQYAIDPAKTAFFLDVDGTLLGFKDRPEDVVADAALIDLLIRLKQVSGDAVAFVSGRSLGDLDRIAAPLVLPVGAVHGADLRFADGRRETMDGAALDEVRSAARAFVAAHPGVGLEDKGATIALHYRAVPGRADEIHTFLDTAVAGHDLMIQHGKMVAEVKSARSHKGTAIDILMTTAPFVGRTPLFVGDDLTDEHGFETVNAAGGISIKVGSAHETSIARHRLADPAAVQDFLNLICRAAVNHGKIAIGERSDSV